jgi:hypothetical protein
VLERFNPVLKIICLALAALVLFQLSRLVLGRSPLRDLNVPTVASAAASEARPKTATNSAPSPAFGTLSPSEGERDGVRGRQRKEPQKKEADVPSAIQARAERITQSEILGPVVRPLPMALLGIAGKDAFLRTADGQTGLLREGDELSGVKLLRIGTNRVLIEHEGQKKELTVFLGFGSETLLESKNPK